MSRLQHQMLRIVYQFFLVPGVPSPEEIHHRPVLSLHRPYYGIRELLPALSLVRIRLVRSHREHGIEEQYTLFGPSRQITGSRYPLSHILVDLFVYVLQRRRDIHTLRHGKRHTHSLSRLMVGVLSDDHRPDTLQRRQMQRGKEHIRRRIHRPRLILILHEFIELFIVFLMKLILESLSPRSGQPCHLTGTPSPRRYSLTSRIVSSL